MVTGKTVGGFIRRLTSAATSKPRISFQLWAIYEIHVLTSGATLSPRSHSTQPFGCSVMVAQVKTVAESNSLNVTGFVILDINGGSFLYGCKTLMEMQGE